MTTNEGEPTASQAMEAKEAVRKEQQDLMDELTEFDHITRFFKNKCFAFADEADQTAAISSLINCEDKFVEAYMVTVGKVYQESRKRVYAHYKNVKHMYLFLTAEESLLDSDGHRINSLVAFIGVMYNTLLKLRSDALTLCEAIRQIKTSQSSSFFPLHGSASFQKVWMHIAEIMYQFSAVDQLASLYPQLGNKFSEFQTKIKKLFDSDFTPEEKKLYEEGAKAQEDAQSMILKGNCFRTLYESAGGDMDNSINFANEMKEAILEMLNNWEKGYSELPIFISELSYFYFGNTRFISDQGKSDSRFFCGISAITVYYYHHFSNYVDQSLIRKVVQASKKVVYYRMLGEELFIPMEFLRREISNPKIFDSKNEKYVKQLVEEARDLGKDNEDGMLKEIKDYCGYALIWMAEFKQKKREQMESINKLPQWGLDVAELFLKCIRIMETITRNIYLLIRSKREQDFHRIALEPKCSWAILTAIETVKKLEGFVLDNWNTVEEGAFLARQQWRKHMLRILGDARKSYTSSKSKNISTIESTTKRSFYHIAEAQCVNEMIASRNVVLSLAYEIGKLETHVSNTDRKQVHDLMSRLETFNSPRHLLEKASYTGLLLSHSWLPLMYFDTLIHRKPDLEGIEAFCCALGGFIEGAKLTGQTVSLLTKLRETVMTTIITKMAAKIDLDLRILGNSHLAIGTIEQSDVPDEEMAYIGYLIKTVKRFQVGTTIVPITESLRIWLENHWYSMGILAPKDAQVYSKMQQIAKFKYGLVLLDADLRQTGVDESLILLDLLQNFPRFVTNYGFFSQGYMFMEKASDSKRLHCIRMVDLKNALLQHGVGILPTAVNAAYQLIRNKIQTFLSFLAEDTVRYQIQKHLHEMEANKSSSDGRRRAHYKVSWAASVLKNLAKQNLTLGGVVSLGPSGTENGTEQTPSEVVFTYFDKFRLIITQIGNAISLVRMLCQAARENQYTREDLFPAIKKHMEDLESISRGLIHTGRRAAPINITRLHATYRLGLVKEMFERVSEHRNYTKMMCVEFKTLLNKSKLPEDRIDVLDYFHGVIPALTLSHVNYMMTHENRVKKTFALKGHKDLLVADDGFAAGIAFLLHVLDGWDAYFKLNWFDSYTL
ncbi:hypothetical protein CRE_26059 [Caenorhabditis remanei]|uniref:Uncharacterized protein n=1 Tax=Caenorhabditis remanei TaxID=31234 RepID=E3LRG7_CAERE|nr:hypothetical protein CRE_26059 [Caenorhabditis remanei]